MPASRGLAGAAVRAFSLHELVAEKLRAQLQQSTLEKYRRQEIYDIALVEHANLTPDDRATIHAILIEKCRTRDIVSDARSFDDPEVRRRAETNWKTLGIELAALPQFDERFELVRDLYRRLPWCD